MINEISALRNEQSFSTIYEEVSTFCIEHDIDLPGDSKARRSRNVPLRFKDFLITSTIGNRDDLKTDEEYRTNLFYPILDSILSELKDRFSDDNILILNAISALCPESSNFLHTESIRPFAMQMNVDFPSLCNEIQVLKPMLKEKQLDNIVDLYIELLPLKQAFPKVMSLLLVAMTIPVSSTTCERTFSKMKLIKTKTRNSMSDGRLSDLCILAIERDFDIDLEKVIDHFAENHKNCRILLK